VLNHRFGISHLCWWRQ